MRPRRQMSRIVKRRELRYLIVFFSMVTFRGSGRRLKIHRYPTSSPSSCHLPYLKHVEAGVDDEVDAKETDYDTAQGGNRHPGQSLLPPAERNPQVDCDAIDKPGNERPGF